MVGRWRYSSARGSTVILDPWRGCYSGSTGRVFSRSICRGKVSDAGFISPIAAKGRTKRRRVTPSKQTDRPKVHEETRTKNSAATSETDPRRIALMAELVRKTQSMPIDRLQALVEFIH